MTPKKIVAKKVNKVNKVKKVKKVSKAVQAAQTKRLMQTANSVIARIRAARQPISEHLRQAAASEQAQPLHVGSRNVKILIGRKRRGGLRSRIKTRFARLMHRVITPSPAAPLQVTSFRGLPELSGVASGVASGVSGGIGKVFKAAMGDEDDAERPKTPRIVGLRIS